MMDALALLVAWIQNVAQIQLNWLPGDSRCSWWKSVVWLAGEKYFVDCVSISLVASSFKHNNQVVVGGSRAKLLFPFL